MFGREAAHPGDAGAFEEEPDTDDIGPPIAVDRGAPGGDRGPGPYAAREASLEGPIWTVPDRPVAARPDFTWSPEEDGRGPSRPPVNPQRRRDTAPAPLPMEHPYPDQPRARPRPRPRPGHAPPESRSTVYVSRHAAEPS